MNQFKEHMKNNNDAKEVLLAVIKTNLAKYMAGQDVINRALMEVKLPVKKCKKGKKGKKDNCVICEINYIFKKMAESQGIVVEGRKTFNMLFDEDLDMDALIHEISHEYFDGQAKSFNPSDNNIILSEDAPQEIKDICNKIMGEFVGKGLNGVKIEVIDVKADNFGLRQEDFENFGDFCRAVSAAREANASGKTGEEILSEAIIHKAEMDTEEKPKEKLN